MTLSAGTAETARPPGSRKTCTREFTCGNSYPTGGESCPVAEFPGMKKILSGKVFVITLTESSTIRVTNARYDVTNEKVLLYDSATGKEVEAGKDCSKVKILVEVSGY